MHFKKNILLYTIIPIIIFIGIASYYRFMVLRDYLVSYEGDCDPMTEDCFVGCEDDECTEEYYYTVIERHAAEVYAQCGADITDCDAAYECTGSEEICSISYCSATAGDEDCETLGTI